MSVDKAGLVKFTSDLTVRWLTYSSDSAGLLDFEHKYFNRHYLNIRKGFYKPELYLVGDGNSCRVFSDLTKTLAYLRSNSRSHVLVKISNEDGKIFVSAPDRSVFHVNYDMYRLISEKASKRVYGHFKTSSSLPIALREGDEIRLGRVKLIVRHLAYNSSLSLGYLQDLMNSDGSNLDSVQSETVNYTYEPQDSAPVLVDSEAPNLIIANNGNFTDLVAEDETPSQSDLNLSLQGKLKTPSKEDGADSDDDNATLCDLSTSRTSVTADKIIQMTDIIENTCRICLCNDDNSGPLITPCKCKGSLTYVHLSCIRSWIKGRLNCPDGSPNKTYFWQKLTCELCGTLYPNKISINNMEHDFVDIEQPTAPYLVLEPENMVDKGYFIVSLSDNPAIIGRGHDCDIRLTDISVSRVHSLLYFDNDHFVIQDKRSKFGTLINNGPESGFRVQLSASTPILLKVGNGLLSINMKRPFRPFCCGTHPGQALTYSL